MLSDHSDNSGITIDSESDKFQPDPPPRDSENPFNIAMQSPPGSPIIIARPEENENQILDAEAPIEIAQSQKSSMHTNAPPPFETDTEQMILVDKIRTKFHISNELLRAALAEMFCTGFLIFGGEAVSAQFVLSQRKMDEWICVALGWALALTFAVLMGARISGAHLNPAVSLFQLTQGKINVVRFLVYVVAQNVGAFFGALTVYVLYFDAINAFDGGNRTVTGPTATASIFATYPGPHLGVINGMMDQIIGTAILCIGVAAICDHKNRIPPFLQPAFIGALLAFIGMSLSLNSGYAINPARDFGPRLFTLFAGYGWRVFSYRSYKWFWIPIICPMIGGVIGAWMYEFFIGYQIPEDPETTYIHKILDERNPDGHLREIHVVEKKPQSETFSDDHNTTPYRNM
ncbi:unnamed protein product [Caenorhabditis bovis]|uniref:Uncharacterized protein n=1 Tax=Caenorhabditis bovis TaxID=2654633 RepID=A0A8S1E5T5_9PELO|nr:unnamed protein product [Caenorhabditis bovis]